MDKIGHVPNGTAKATSLANVLLPPPPYFHRRGRVAGQVMGVTRRSPLRETQTLAKVLTDAMGDRPRPWPARGQMQHTHAAIIPNISENGTVSNI